MTIHLSTISNKHAAARAPLLVTIDLSTMSKEVAAFKVSTACDDEPQHYMQHTCCPQGTIAVILDLGTISKEDAMCKVSSAWDH